MPAIELDAGLGAHSLADLFSAMEYAVFEAVGERIYPLNPSPEWLHRLAECDDPGRNLVECLPFLESFLPDAFAFWKRERDGRVQSDFWTQTDVAGAEVHLLAYAVGLEGRRILLIWSAEQLYKEREAWQIYAHETAMQLKTIEGLQCAMQEAANALAAANAKLSELSTLDSLTGVYNRRHFEHALELEIRRTYRANEPISILFLDIDHFKLLNDTHGHIAGDECLRSIGNLLKDLLKRPGDMVARVGGEEFAIILPGVDADGAFQFAGVINQKVRELKIPNPASDGSISATVSIGVYARSPKSDESVSQILQAADNALYEAKRGGRDHAVVAVPRKISVTS